jgi:hypothetical protein
VNPTTTQTLNVSHQYRVGGGPGGGGPGGGGPGGRGPGDGGPGGGGPGGGGPGGGGPGGFVFCVIHGMSLILYFNVKPPFRLTKIWLRPNTKRYKPSVIRRESLRDVLPGVLDGASSRRTVKFA